MLDSIKNLFNRDRDVEVFNETESALNTTNNTLIEKVVYKYQSPDTHDIIGICLELKNKKRTVVTYEKFNSLIANGDIPLEKLDKTMIDNAPTIKLFISLYAMSIKHDNRLSELKDCKMYKDVTVVYKRRDDGSGDWLKFGRVTDFSDEEAGLHYHVWTGPEGECPTLYYILCDTPKGEMYFELNHAEAKDLAKSVYIPGLRYVDDIGLMEPLDIGASRLDKTKINKDLKFLKLQLKVMRYLNVRSLADMPLLRVPDTVYREFKPPVKESSNTSAISFVKAKHEKPLQALSGIAVSKFTFSTSDVNGYRIMLPDMTFKDISLNDLTYGIECGKFKISNLIPVDISGKTELVSNDSIPESKVGLICTEVLIKDMSSYSSVAIHPGDNTIYHVLGACPSPSEYYTYQYRDTSECGTLYKMEYHAPDGKVYSEVCNNNDVVKLLLVFDVPGLKLLIGNRVLVDCNLVTEYSGKDTKDWQYLKLGNASELIVKLNDLLNLGIQDASSFYDIIDKEVNSKLIAYNINTNDYLATKSRRVSIEDIGTDTVSNDTGNDDENIEVESASDIRADRTVQVVTAAPEEPEDITQIKRTLYDRLMRLPKEDEKQLYINKSLIYVIDVANAKSIIKELKLNFSEDGIIVIIPDDAVEISSWDSTRSEFKVSTTVSNLITKYSNVVDGLKNVYLVGGFGLKTTAALLDGVNANELSLEYFCTKNVTDMSFMFKNIRVNKLNLTNFYTSKVYNMYGMFFDASAPEFNLQSFDTRGVYAMNYMFALSDSDKHDKPVDIHLESFDLKATCEVSCFLNRRNCNIFAKATLRRLINKS